MYFPSYLVKNRFGIFYFQLVFPKNIRKILKKKEVRRSLKTTDRGTAIIMAQEFRKIAVKRLFPVILRGNMNWIETKNMLDNIAQRLFELYVQQVDEVGPDAYNDPYTIDKIMPEAKTFLGTPPSDQVSSYHFDSDKKDIEDRYHKTKTVTDLVDHILNSNGLNIDHDSDEYKQVLEMLYRLDGHKEAFKNNMTSGTSVICATPPVPTPYFLILLLPLF